jgi:hypothetical protein
MHLACFSYLTIQCASDRRVNEFSTFLCQFFSYETHTEHTKIPNNEVRFGCFCHQALIIGSLHMFMMTVI